MKRRMKSLLLLFMTVVLVGTSAGIEVVAKENEEPVSIAENTEGIEDKETTENKEVNTAPLSNEKEAEESTPESIKDDKASEEQTVEPVQQSQSRKSEVAESNKTKAVQPKASQPKVTETKTTQKTSSKAAVTTKKTTAKKPYTGWKKRSGKYYYYYKGKKVKGWKKVGKYTYYFNSKGQREVNKIVGNKKKGYYYVDKSGKRVTTKEVRQAVSFVRKYTKSSWSKSKKLKVCYDKLWKKYPYKRSYDGYSAKKMPKFARDMFTKKKGNCYRYASAFAYIARVIGYDSRVAVGKIAHRGGGTTPHGWTEVKSGGRWKKCDANMQRSYPRINCYMQTKYRFNRQSCSKRYTLKVSNGKVSWK